MMKRLLLLLSLCFVGYMFGADEQEKVPKEIAQSKLSASAPSYHSTPPMPIKGSPKESPQRLRKSMGEYYMRINSEELQRRQSKTTENKADD